MGKIPENFSGISRNWVLRLISPQNFPSWGPILRNFSRISEESVKENGSREIPWKFYKESHHEQKNSSNEQKNSSNKQKNSSNKQKNSSNEPK